MLTFGKTGFGTRGGDCFVDHFGMTQGGYSLLCNGNCTTDGAVFALGQAGVGAVGCDCFVDHFGVAIVLALCLAAAVITSIVIAVAVSESCINYCATNCTGLIRGTGCGGARGVNHTCSASFTANVTKSIAIARVAVITCGSVTAVIAIMISIFIFTAQIEVNCASPSAIGVGKCICTPSSSGIFWSNVNVVRIFQFRGGKRNFSVSGPLNKLVCYSLSAGIYNDNATAVTDNIRTA